MRPPLAAAHSDQARLPSHEGYVDALRGWAFLAVFAFHTSRMVEGLPPLLADVLGRGWAGVQLFFVVSAFTLCRSLAARASDPVPLRAYFLRRAFRILPMFWCAIGLYLVLDGFAPRWGVPDGLAGRHVVLAVLLLHGFDPHALNGVVPGGWSVATEVEFYLILPLMLRWASSLKRAIALWAATVALSIVALPGLELLLAPLYPAAQRDLVHQFAFFALPTQLPVFVAGVILYRLLGPDRAALRRLEGWLPPSPRQKAILVMLTVLIIGLPLRPVWPLSLAARIPGHLGYSVLFALLAYALATYPLGVLVNPVSHFFGRISYSGYLMHFAVLAGVERVVSPLVEGWSMHLALLGAGALATTAAASTLSHALIEQPGIALGRSLIARPSHPPCSLVRRNAGPTKSADIPSSRRHPNSGARKGASPAEAERSGAARRA